MINAWAKLELPHGVVGITPEGLPGILKKKPKFVPAKNIKTAENWAKVNAVIEGGEVNYTGMDLGVVNDVNRALYDQIVKPGRGKLNRIVARKGDASDIASYFGNSIYLHEPMWKVDYYDQIKLSSKKVTERLTKLKGSIKEIEKSHIKLGSNPLDDPYLVSLKKRLARSKKIVRNRFTVQQSAYDTINHELGHGVNDRLLKANRKLFVKYNRKLDSTFKTGKANKLSEYSASDRHEYAAELWASFYKGEKVLINKIDKDLWDLLIQVSEVLI
jgi:hypothetical protein